MIIYSQRFPERGREEGILRQGDFVISVLSNLRDHSENGVEAIRTAGSTADGRFPPLLIELKAQFYKLVTL